MEFLKNMLLCSYRRIFLTQTEFCGPLCAQYQHVFLQPLLEYTKDKSPEVRQAATYGCGVLAQVTYWISKIISII